VAAFRCCGGTHRLAAEAPIEKHCSHRISVFDPVLPLEPADSRKSVESVAAVAWQLGKKRFFLRTTSFANSIGLPIDTAQRVCLQLKKGTSSL
jgi:hypothetical protein